MRKVRDSLWPHSHVYVYRAELSEWTSHTIFILFAALVYMGSARTIRKTQTQIIASAKARNAL